MQAHYIRGMLEKSMRYIEEHIEDYVVHPRDLSRRRKLPPFILLLYLMSAGCRSTITELQNLFQSFQKMPVASALSMQRAKLKPEAVQEMFRLFNQALQSRGGRPPAWRFIAVDGTHFSCADRDRNNTAYDDWRHSSGKKHLEGEVTAAYDLRAMRFLTAVIQPLRKMNERAAYSQILDELKDAGSKTKTCFVADRGFPSWNVLGQTWERGMYFLIRTTEEKTRGSLLTQLQLPEREHYDVTVKVRFVRYQRMMKDSADGRVNVLLANNVEFDYLPPGSAGEYLAEFRVVRHKSDQGETVTVITNLPPDEFSTRKIMQLYRERWLIETAFGQLKGALAMESFHTNRPELLAQEVWAKMTAFNYVSAIRRAANRRAQIRRREKGARLKHSYEVDFTFACTAALAFLNPNSPYSKEQDLIDTVSRKCHPVHRKRGRIPRGDCKRRTPLPATHRCAL